MDIKSKNNNQINPNNQNIDTEIKIERKHGKKYNITNKGILVIILSSLILFSTAFLCFASIKKSKYIYENSNYINNTPEIKFELIRYAKNLDRFYIYFDNFNPELAKNKISDIKYIIKDMESNKNTNSEKQKILSSGTYESNINEITITNTAEVVDSNYNDTYDETIAYASDETDVDLDNLEEDNEFLLDNNESPESLYEKDINNMNYNQLNTTLSVLTETLENYNDVKNYLNQNRWFKYYITNKETGEIFTNSNDFESEGFFTRTDIYDSIFQDTFFNGEFIPDAFSKNNLECEIIIPSDIPRDSEIASLIREANQLHYLYNNMLIAAPILLMISLVLLGFSLITNKNILKLYIDKLYKLYEKLPFTVSAVIGLMCIFEVFMPFSNRDYSLINALYYNANIRIVFMILLQSFVFIYLLLFLKNIINIIRNPKILKESFELKLIYKTFKDVKLIMKSQNILLLIFYLLILVFILITLGILCFFILTSIRYYFLIESILLFLVFLFILSLEIIALNIISAYCKLSYYILEISKGTIENIPEQKGMFLKPINNLNNINSEVKVTINKMIKNERLKTELITNVSHDLKTPLTSIISYIDLLKELHLNDANACEYINIIDCKSQRLKILIEDLFEASKLSTGQYELEIKNADIVELFKQTLGELSNKIENSNIDFKYTSSSEHIFLYIDGNKMWRVFENLLNNIIKYSQPQSRAYITILETDLNVIITMKNVSSYEMDFDANELFERFKRGDSSRTTEGSGLGLSISKSIIELHGGTMDIIIDGDLFKIVITLNK